MLGPSKHLLVPSQKQNIRKRNISEVIDERVESRSGVFVINFEYISHLFYVFLLLNLDS